MQISFEFTNFDCAETFFSRIKHNREMQIGGNLSGSYTKVTVFDAKKGDISRFINLFKEINRGH